MNAPERAQPAADNALSAEQRQCQHCGAPFTPRRSWAVFCSPQCRNDFHGLEARRVAIQAAAPAMFEALRLIAAGAVDPGELARAAIKDLKAP